MDEKKVREAIELIDGIIVVVVILPEGGGDINKALDLAIEALEKQLPEKVKQSGVTTQDGIFHRINGIDGVPYDLCPNCEVNLCTDGILGRNKKDMKYCERCGQRLDWSEE